MNVFQSALNAVAPHFRVRGHTLFIAQGDLFSQVEIDLSQVAAHKLPGLATLHLRLFRGRWKQYAMEGFRPTEISRLRALLTRWEKQNHHKHEAVA
jgi:hypothetical protein